MNQIYKTSCQGLIPACLNSLKTEKPVICSLWRSRPGRADMGKIHLVFISKDYDGHYHLNIQLQISALQINVSPTMRAEILVEHMVK